MLPSLPIIIILKIASASLNQVSAQFTFRHSGCSGGTYEPNSPYQTNLKTVLNSLSSNTNITYGFYNFTAGEPPNQVHSLAICRGDVPLGTCRVCISDSANAITETCPNQMNAFGYSEYCTIYVTNTSIYGVVVDLPRWYLTGSDTIADTVGFNALFTKSLLPQNCEFVKPCSLT